jgi:hypothetical protein
MKKVVLTFGLIAGVLCSAMMTASVALADRIGQDHSYLLGYTILVLSFLLVFFGIRSYRENVADGTITFARGFTVGILITLITCVCYVVTWEIVYYNFMPDFMDKYAAHQVAKAKAAGMSQAALQAQIAQIEKMKVLYANPLYNAALTFLEPFPVGLVITLISAAVLRKKRVGALAGQQAGQAAS